MTNDQTKNAGPVAHEHPYPPTMTPFPQGFGATYPGYPAVYFAQPPDSNHGDGANGATPAPPFVIPLSAPGMIYPYPPGQPFPQYAQSASPAANGQRPKRKQVKMACTNCATACKRCNESRPCERCIKYGIQESCVDGVRKERQKGIKRGPYKRKNKSTGGEASFEATNGDSEWQDNGTSTSNPSSAPSQPATVHAVPHYPPPPEGYFPYFFPPPGFMPPGHEGAPAPEGASGGTSQPPAMVQYYPMPPPGYFTYPPPAVFPPAQNGNQVPTIDPAEASRTSTQAPKAAATTGKKRTRAGKQAETKTKKAKVAVTVTSESSTSGGTVGGNDQEHIDPGNISPVDDDDDA